MTELKRTITEALVTELHASGVATAQPRDHHVAFADLSIRVHVAEAILESTSSGDEVVTVIFDVRPSGESAHGAKVLSVGFGANASEAARDAASQWTVGVYPVIQTWLTRTHDCRVGSSQMVVALQDTGDRFGWRVHLGPVIGRLYGTRDTDRELGPLDQNEIYQALFNVVAEFAAHQTLFWLECFAIKHPDGSVDATCRMHNENWPEGYEALLAYAASWPDTRGCTLSKRQFIMFEPSTVRDLSEC